MRKRIQFTLFQWFGGHEHAHDIPIGTVYAGHLLKLTAVDRFFFDHHGGSLVSPGIEKATHANVVSDRGSQPLLNL